MYFKRVTFNSVKEGMKLVLGTKRRNIPKLHFFTNAAEQGLYIKEHSRSSNKKLVQRLDVDHYIETNKYNSTKLCISCFSLTSLFKQEDQTMVSSKKSKVRLYALVSFALNH
jgi:hypothetical protein